jgi:hypothetical protein
VRGGGGGARCILRPPVECFSCNANDLDKHLDKCPICFRWACEGCATHAYGRHFCSKKCSDEFFYGDDEDE